MSVKHKTCQSAFEQIVYASRSVMKFIGNTCILVILLHCVLLIIICKILVVQMGGTSKEDTHPLFWPRPMFFTPPLLLLPVKNYTEVDRGVAAAIVGIWWSWPRRYCCGPCGNACCSAAWHFVTVFGSGWSAFWCCEKWGFNLAGEIETWSSVRYDNFNHKRGCVRQARPALLSSSRLDVLKKKGSTDCVTPIPPKKHLRFVRSWSVLSGYPFQ